MVVTCEVFGMNGYKIYCMCRQILGRSKVSFKSFENSNDRNYYEYLADHFSIHEGFDKKQIRNYIKSVFRNDPKNFTPFDLLSEESKEIFNKWKKEQSSVGVYLNYINESFDFIENFCINNNITFNEYCLRYAKRHLREEKFDYTIAIYMKMIDRRKLKKVEKILLKKFLNEYNIVKIRTRNPKVRVILEKRSEEMLGTIERYRNIQSEHK